MEQIGNKLDVVSIRLVKDAPIMSETPIQSPKDAVKLLGEYMCQLDREVLCVVNMKANGVPVNCNFASVGSLNQSIAAPREIFKSSILSNAATMLIIHNHPSGKLSPSMADTMMTDRMLKLCDLMGIPLEDHIIVGGNNEEYFSFREHAMLKFETNTYLTDYRDVDFTEQTVAESNYFMKTEAQDMGEEKSNEEPKGSQITVTLTVSESSEFLNLGEYHENVASVDEAIALWGKIPQERMNGNPSIGINIHTEGREPYEDVNTNILIGNTIDLEFLEFYPEILDNARAIDVIEELIAKLPDKEVIGSIEEAKAHRVEIEKRDKELREMIRDPAALQKEPDPIKLHIKYKEPVNFNGFVVEKDSIIFDDLESVIAFANGELAYDTLDNAVRKRENDIPLYAENSHGEIVWGMSEHEICMECMKDIKKKIADNFDGYSLKNVTAESLIAQYGMKRVEYVLANTVAQSFNDVRFSEANRRWAKGIVPETELSADLILNTHPGLLNGFINQVRWYQESMKEPEKQGLTTRASRPVKKPEKKGPRL